MTVQKCEKCKKKFSYKDLIKTFLFGKGDLKCKSCKAVHTQSGLGKMIFLILIIIIPISFQQMVVKIIGSGTVKISFVYLIYVMLVISLIPFMIKYELKKDY